jgi:hypothetical protein
MQMNRRVTALFFRKRCAELMAANGPLGTESPAREAALCASRCG